MTPREKTASMLTGIASTLQIESGLSLNDEDACIFTIDDKFEFILYFDETIEQLLINLPLGTLPIGNKGRDLAIEMLAGNYAWTLTAGATLGLDDQTGIVSLCHNFDVSEGQGGGFEQFLSEMIGAADYWMEKIEEAAKDDIDPSLMEKGIRV